MNPTRRDALRTGALLTASVIAGCTSSSTTTQTGTHTRTPTRSTSAADTTATASTDGRSPARRATLHTTKGDVRVELSPEKVPNTVANFVGLATGDQEWEDPETGETRTDPLYDDVPFHRVIDDFMIQTGDPTGTGRGGPGYTFDDEFHDDLRHDGPGVLSMANRGPDTNGSQFFITLAAQPHLDGRHAVFGRVTDRMDVVREIGSVPTDGADRPREEVLLESVDVAGGDR
jgi:peptidyl-prolyl cis-trans isomerase A (cyclophilin A)